MTAQPRFSDGNYQKAEREAIASVDELAKAEALDQLHKRCGQLTSIYKAEIAAAIRAASAFHDDIEESRIDWLDADLGELRENAFDDFADKAQTIRERIKGGY